MLLESLGYLQLRHSIEFGALESLLKPFTQQFLNYRQFNERDLGNLKIDAFEEGNYEQIENFIDYQRYLDCSYFSYLMKHVNLCFALIKAGSTNIDEIKDSFLSYFGKEDELPKLMPTQDIKVVQPKYFAPEEITN